MDSFRVPSITEFPEAERTPSLLAVLALCGSLYEMILQQAETIQQLRDEIARLKGQKGGPDIKPNALEGKQRGGVPPPGKRPGSLKRAKTATLPITKTIDVPAENVPVGSVRKGREEYTVQDLIIIGEVTRYRRELWQTPDGKTLTAALPPGIHGHFGSSLRSFVIDQHQLRVTQSRIFEELQDFGIDISEGQINAMLTEHHEAFHAEKDAILQTGLLLSSYINTDDTGARHAGKNGYCTHIGNALFAWFQSTESKSRINFLQILRIGMGQTDYVLDKEAFAYMKEQALSQEVLVKLRKGSRKIGNDAAWGTRLDTLGITDARHRRIATEGALLGSLLHHGLPSHLVVLSDDAGQFNVLMHALCWIHAERNIQKLLPCNDDHRNAIEDVRAQIWNFYDQLKTYKQAPLAVAAESIRARFDVLFTQQTAFPSLNDALLRIHRNKRELLLVLGRPEIPLHNNESERDIREYVIKRKVSGGTRSDKGRQSRDTFMSLRKTCRKLGVNFWDYLNDRLSGTHRIPPLCELLAEKLSLAVT